MKILVCGGRDFIDYELLSETLTALCPLSFEETYQEVRIIHGGAKGADLMADKWAINRWIVTEEFKADWDKHSKAAGPIRNQQMIDEGRPDIVVAFPGGKGTADMVRRARAAKINVIEVK